MKKKKLNSKNPKYWDKSQLTEKKVIKEVKGKAAIRNSSGNIVGETTVRGVWYEQCYTRALQKEESNTEAVLEDKAQNT